MKTLYEGILSDIETTINADVKVKSIDIFGSMAESNVKNFKDNLDKFLKYLKSIDAKLEPKNKAYYRYPKNHVFVITRKNKSGAGEFTVVCFASDMDLRDASYIKLDTYNGETTIETASAHEIINFYHIFLRLRNCDYPVYDMYKIPDKYEFGIKYAIDKINERL